MKRFSIFLWLALLAASHAAPPKVPEMPRERAPAKGDVGVLYAQRCLVIQVVDEQNALVRIEWYDHAGRAINNARPMFEYAWLTGPTDGMVDGRMFTNRQVYEAIGTKRYTSQAGVRSVIHLEATEWKPAGKKKR